MERKTNVKKIFEHYGGVITAAIAVICLVAIIAMMIGNGGWMTGAFKSLVKGFEEKTMQAITGGNETTDSTGGLELETNSGTVPDGWIYTQISDGTKLYPGDPLPAVYSTGDTMEDSDYIYTISNPLESYGCANIEEFKALVQAEIGMSWDDYLAAVGMTEEQVIAELTAQWSVVVKVTTKETYGDVYSKLLGFPVTYMGGTYEDCTALKISPKISVNATYMHSTYKNCTSLTQAPAIPANVTNMYYAFQNCSSLVNPPDMSAASKVVNMEGAFNECAKMTAMPDLSNANSVENMKSTFSGCSSLKITSAIPESVTNMLSTFGNCKALEVAPTIPQNVTDIDHTFNGCIALTTAPTILANVTTMDSTFMNCEKLNTYTGSTAAAGDLSGYIIPATVTNMQYTFWNCDSITKAPKLPDNVENIRSTFNSCAALTTAPVIPASVTNMYGTFSHCTELTGTVTVNTNPSSYTDCFYLTKITGINGTTTMQDQLLATIN